MPRLVATAALALLLTVLVSPARSRDAGPVVVAVIDSGADLTHPSIAGALWSNPGEIAGNGYDDDANGFVDDVHGADVVTGDGDPSDEHGHGTHVTGLVARAAPAGVMVVRALDAGKAGTAAGIHAAVRYALTHGADVINLSVNADDTDDDLSAAVQEASDADVPVVTAAGNDARSLDVAPSYPACSRASGVIAVAATDEAGTLAAFSNTGSCVDLTAPGVGVRSAAPGGGTAVLDGSSQAAARVTGLVAQLVSERRDHSLAALGTALRSP